MTNRMWVGLSIFSAVISLIAFTLHLIVESHSFHLIINLAFILFLIYFIYHNYDYIKRFLFIDLRIILTFFFTIYFVVGALYIFYDPDYTIVKNPIITKIDEKITLLIDSINYIGFSLLLLGSLIKFPNLRIIKYEKYTKYKYKILIIFTIIYLFLKISIIINDITFSPFLVPGYVRLLSYGIYAYIFYIIIYDKSKFSSIIVNIILISLIFFGFISLSKTEIFIPFLVLLYKKLRYQNIKINLFLGTFLFLIMFKVSGSLVEYCRVNIDINYNYNQIAYRTNLLYQAVNKVYFKNIIVFNDEHFISKNQNTTKIYSNTNKPNLTESIPGNDYSIWRRISYIDVQNAVIILHNNNLFPDDLHLLPWIFIPRFINTHKPFLSNQGNNLYKVLTGYSGSSTGPGIFVGAYYSSGLCSLIFISVLCGSILKFYSYLNFYIIKTKSIILYPLIVINIYTAIRIDGEWLTDFFGIMINTSYLLILIFLINIFLKNIYAKYLK